MFQNISCVRRLYPASDSLLTAPCLTFIYFPDPWLTARVDYLQPNHGRDAWRKAVRAKRGAWHRVSISERRRRRAEKFEQARRAALK